MREKEPYRVLIATLGQSAGTVTGMLDALAEAKEGPKVQMDEVVTLYTRDTGMFPIRRYGSWKEALTDYESHPLQMRVLCQQLGPEQLGVFEAELYGHYERVWEKALRFDPRVGYLQDTDGQGIEDITNNWHNFLFLKLAYQTIAQHREGGHEIYVSLVGGRKTMSALLHLAAQSSGGVAGSYHLIVPDEIERLSSVERWNSLALDEKQRVLHPGLESTLVPIPIIPLPREWSDALHEQLQILSDKDTAPGEDAMKLLAEAIAASSG